MLIRTLILGACFYALGVASFMIAAPYDIAARETVRQFSSKTGMSTGQTVNRSLKRDQLRRAAPFPAIEPVRSPGRFGPIAPAVRCAPVDVAGRCFAERAGAVRSA